MAAMFQMGEINRLTGLGNGVGFTEVSDAPHKSRVPAHAKIVDTRPYSGA